MASTATEIERLTAALDQARNRAAEQHERDTVRSMERRLADAVARHDNEQADLEAHHKVLRSAAVKSVIADAAGRASASADATRQALADLQSQLLATRDRLADHDRLLREISAELASVGLPLTMHGERQASGTDGRVISLDGVDHPIAGVDAPMLCAMHKALWMAGHRRTQLCAALERPVAVARMRVAGLGPIDPGPDDPEPRPEPAPPARAARRAEPGPVGNRANRWAE